MAFGDVVVLAVPYAATAAAIKAAGSLNGKIVLTCINALKPDYSGLATGTTSSAAEEVAALAPGAKVVEGLPAFAEVLQSSTQSIEGEAATIFVAGEDTEAKRIAADLLTETGAQVIDAGPLRAARFIEPAIFLLVHLAYLQGFGGRVGWKLLHDPKPSVAQQEAHENK